jgi:hypothetical protein
MISATVIASISPGVTSRKPVMTNLPTGVLSQGPTSALTETLPGHINDADAEDRPGPPIAPQPSWPVIAVARELAPPIVLRAFDAVR